MIDKDVSLETTDENLFKLEYTDILNASKIIAAAMERGNTFNAEELIQVSVVYSRLSNFCKSVQEAEEQKLANEKGE